MRSIFTGVLILLSLSCSAQKICTPNLDSVKMVMPPDLISFIDTIQTVNFSDKTDRRNIPKFIKKALSCWGKGKFRVVNPGKLYNNTDVIFRNRPRRQLNYLGMSNSFILLSYNHGGIGLHSHILILKCTNKTIQHVWNIYGAAGSKEEIISRLKYIQETNASRTNYFEF